MNLKIVLLFYYSTCNRYKIEISNTIQLSIGISDSTYFRSKYKIAYIRYNSKINHKFISLNNNILIRIRTCDTILNNYNYPMEENYWNCRCLKF